jgi:hypothetical protein
MIVNTKVHKLLRSRLFRISGLLVIAIVVFYTGYQLAIYQEANNDNLWPHFNIGINSQSTGSCTPGFGVPNECPTNGLDEPVINLYPTKAEAVNVRLSFAPGFSKTVPAYSPSSGWNVIAQPNGQLIDRSSGMVYPYLIWEGNPVNLNVNMNEGFVVPVGSTKQFLQNELAVIGLSRAEVSAFIGYWLPRMQDSKYNLIHFDENTYTSIAKLTVTPRPDSLLRVLMVYKPLRTAVRVTPQLLTAFHRRGFTVVEWGGTEI